MLEWLERSDGWLVETAKKLGQTLTLETKAAKPASTTTPAREKLPTVDDSAIDELITQVYQRTVSRNPTDAEIARSRKHLKSGENTIEFLTNH